jgi:WD40 repeat protein
LAASTLGELYCIDVRNGETVRTYKGNTGPINDFVEVSPLEIVVTAGEDRECRIFDLRGIGAGK